MTDAIPEPATVGGVTRDKVVEQLRDLYVCTRHESAWGYGTMSLDDFIPAWEDEDVIANFMGLFPPAPSTVGTVEESGLNALAGKLNRAVEIRNDYDRGYAQCMEDTLTDLNVIRNLTPATTRDVGAEELRRTYVKCNKCGQTVPHDGNGMYAHNTFPYSTFSCSGSQTKDFAASAKGDGK